jgi:hypothetical protein
MKDDMEKTKVTNVVNNTVTSSTSNQTQGSMEEFENDEPSYLRKVLYG